ncbi:MAG: 1-deoxy-D-xylulose-5-phosphate synthase [Cytophagales bacterium]|nr:MAG: 1-deoxy-D-xylulose-5-phosphate synthase [Cytophagales bacterium]
MQINQGNILKNIQSPDDLKNLTLDELVQLCVDLRQFIIDNVSIYGGHFGASLGVVELTVALHHVFNTPDDRLVWDVGHQAYGHKILTGRKDDFHTNRRYKGLSGFPKISESPYDAFGVGHSSTSISAALGMAMASTYKNEKDRQHIAIIGDGAMTAGMAFEAMNHAGVSNSNLLIVLNDNCMAIDPNVGALKDYLTDITTSHTYNKFRDDIWKLLGKISKFGPNAQAIASNMEAAVKAAFLKQSNLFESLKLRYFGPVDGHDVAHLIEIFKDLKDIQGPKLLHVITTKGKGYKFAEEGNPTFWHAPGVKFDKITGELQKKSPVAGSPPKFQDVFGETIIEIAKQNDKVMGITPAMPTGCSLNLMMKEMPERAFDVGIAEQHAVTFSAGLAVQGLIPFCNIYSSFMQRAYDQVFHDVCLQNLHVIFCLDRAGIAGADGPTHHGTYDIAYMRCLPNMIVSAPMDEIELRNLMFTGTETPQPFSIRYPRGVGVISDWRKPLQKLTIGKGRKIKSGSDIAILSFGTAGNQATKAIEILDLENISVAHYDLRFAKPLDNKMLDEVFATFDKIITIEDGCLQGGFGSAILEFMSDNQYFAQIKRLGIPDKIIEHGEQADLYAECGFDYLSIIENIKQMMGVVERKV